MASVDIALAEASDQNWALMGLLLRMLGGVSVFERAARERQTSERKR